MLEPSAERPSCAKRARRVNQKSHALPSISNWRQGRRHGRWENGAYFTLEPKRNARLAVVLGRTSIDDDVGNSALGRQQRKRSRRVNRQGGAERNDQVRFPSGLVRASEFVRLETLAEADRRRFQESATGTEWRPTLRAKKIEMRLWIAPPFAALTFDERVGTV